MRSQFVNVTLSTYWLEEVDLAGNALQHGPLTVASAAHRLFLPGVFRR